MATGKTKWLYAEGKAQWAKIKEDQRDFGENLPAGSDQRIKLENVQGMYSMNLLLTEDQQDAMEDSGFPVSGMAGQLFKKDRETKQRFYKSTRQHFNPAFVNENSDGIMGPPEVFLMTAGSCEVKGGRFSVSEDFDMVPFDGPIGNESDVVVKYSVWDMKKVTMERILITNLVEFETDSGSANHGGF